MNRISVVVCTYNGEKYIEKQLDSLIAQTYPLHEIIIQDDGSTDGTVSILHRFAQKYPVIKVFQNEEGKGVNDNFLSAMRRVSGELIAVCDQDDIWEPTKIEKQVSCIGEHLLCVCRSRPFSEDGSAVDYDARTPNYRIPRLLFASIPGHTMLFRRDLLDLIPPPDKSCYGTCYDVVLASTAAAYESIVLVDEVLVHQRRYGDALTYIDVDKRRQRSVGNAWFILWWSVSHYRRIKPLMRVHFGLRRKMFSHISSEKPACRLAMSILDAECGKGLKSLLMLMTLFSKHYRYLFYTEKKGFVPFCRGLLYAVMQVYNFRYLAFREK